MRAARPVQGRQGLNPTPTCQPEWVPSAGRLSDGQRLEPQGGGLGCGRTRGGKTANPFSLVYLRKRISKGKTHALIINADNGNHMRAAILEGHLKELGVLRTFSRPRVSSDNTDSVSLIRTVTGRTTKQVIHQRG